MSENEVVGALPARQREYRDLPVKISEEGLRAEGDELAVFEGSLEQVEAAKKEDAAHHNAKIKTLRASIERTAKRIRERQRLELVEVDWKVAPAGEMAMILVRVDTGEELSRREMTEHEKQRSMFPVEQPQAVGDPNTPTAPEAQVGLGEIAPRRDPRYPEDDPQKEPAPVGQAQREVFD